MIEIKAPNFFKYKESKSIFLSGSIEQGTAEEWQKRFIKEFENKNVVFFNPRRDNWNKDEEIDTQVNWELCALDYCNLIVMYFDPKTTSPITLLELGLYVNCESIIVCCPDGFWRKDNVKIICEKYKVPLYNTFNELVIATENIINAW